MVDQKYKDTLANAMNVLGRVVEGVLGQASRVRTTVSAPSPVKPIISIEGQLPIQKIVELMNTAIEATVKGRIPSLVDKSAFEMVDGQMRLSPYIKERGADIAVHIDIGASAGSYPKEKQRSIHSIRSNSYNIPFEDGFFDLFIANLASAVDGGLGRCLKEISRVTTLGGTGVIIDLHPFGRFAKKAGSRLKLISSVKGVEDYYNHCSAAGLSITGLKEVFIDDALRSAFVTPEEKAAFRVMKDTPFLIFLFTEKKGY